LGALALLLGAVAPLRAADSDWSVRITPFDQIFPALELSQARRDAAPRSADERLAGDGSGLIAVRLRARHAGEKVRLTVTAPGLEAPAQVEATLRDAGRDYVLRPPLAWQPRQLIAADAPRDTTVSFHLLRDGADAGTRARNVSLRPLSEALYFVRDGADSVDLSWIFAAYVDERDAVVDRVLAAATASGIVAAFDGYASGSDAAVQRQVWAVWQALAAHGIRYSAADGNLLYSLAVSRDGKLIASGGWLSTIPLHNPDTGNLVRTIKGFKGGIFSMASLRSVEERLQSMLDCPMPSQTSPTKTSFSVTTLFPLIVSSCGSRESFLVKAAPSICHRRRFSCSRSRRSDRRRWRESWGSENRSRRWHVKRQRRARPIRGRPW